MLGARQGAHARARLLESKKVNPEALLSGFGLNLLLLLQEGEGAPEQGP